MAELDRRGMAAVLAADADLEIGFRLPSPLDGDPHEPAHSLDVEDLEGVVLENLPLVVKGQELVLRILPGKGEGGLGEVVRSEGEEVGDLGQCSALMQARTTSIMVPNLNFTGIPYFFHLLLHVLNQAGPTSAPGPCRPGGP